MCKYMSIIVVYMFKPLSHITHITVHIYVFTGKKLKIEILFCIAQTEFKFLLLYIGICVGCHIVTYVLRTHTWYVNVYKAQLLLSHFYCMYASCNFNTPKQINVLSLVFNFVANNVLPLERRFCGPIVHAYKPTERFYIPALLITL